MTPNEYREQLIAKLRTTDATQEQLRGAIAACNEIIAMVADDSEVEEVEEGSDV